jgi:hypothetical protein
MDRGAVRGRALALIVAGASMLACGRAGGVAATTTASPSDAVRSQPPPAGSQEMWLAVYDVDDDPQALSGGRSEILRSLGGAMAGDVVISPAGCFDGLPDRLAHQAYVLGLQQPGRAYVEALVEQLDGQPLFTGRVTVSCTD